MAIKMTHSIYSRIPPQRSTKHSVLSFFPHFLHFNFFLYFQERENKAYILFHSYSIFQKLALLCKTQILILQSQEMNFDRGAEEASKGSLHSPDTRDMNTS